MSKFCSKCGQQLNDTDTQCRYCGAVLRSGAPNASQQANGTAPQQGGFGNAPQQQGYGNMPQQGGFGNAPQQQGYGNMPQQSGFGNAPQQQGYGNMPQQGGFGSEPAKNNNGLIIAIIAGVAVIAIVIGIVVFVLNDKGSSKGGGSNKGDDDSIGYEDDDNSGGYRDDGYSEIDHEGDDYPEINHDRGEDGARSYKELMDNYFNSIIRNDIQLYKSTFADCVKNSDNFKKRIKNFDRNCERYNIASYKIVNKERESSRDLKEFAKDIEESYGEKVSVTDGYTLTVKINLADDDPIETKFHVYEIDGVWGLLND